MDGLRGMFKRMTDFITGADMLDEYMQRFMLPEVERLRSYGVSEVDIARLVHLAIATPDPTVIGQAPGARLRKMADQIQVGNSVDDAMDSVTWSDAP